MKNEFFKTALENLIESYVNYVREIKKAINKELLEQLNKEKAESAELKANMAEEVIEPQKERKPSRSPKKKQ